jgi:hypothetical protein
MGDKFRSGARGNDSSYNRQDCLLAGGTQSKGRRHHHVDHKDIVAHTATVRGDWDVMIPANESVSLVLTKAGIVEYYCRFHPNMKGRITITLE